MASFSNDIRPSCSNLRVRNQSDARTLFHAVACGIYPLVTRRLSARERNSIRHGDVYIWEENMPTIGATSPSMERWTDGIRWLPARGRRDGFVVYNQDCSYVASSSPISLTKQTFQVMTTTALGLRRWHLVAYFLSDRGCNLDTVDDKPELAGLEVPHENYPVPIGGLRRTKASSSLMMPPVPRGALQTSVENIPLPVPKILVPLDSLKAHGTGTRRACDQAMLDSLLRRGSLS